MESDSLSPLGRIPEHASTEDSAWPARPSTYGRRVPVRPRKADRANGSVTCRVPVDTFRQISLFAKLKLAKRARPGNHAGFFISSPSNNQVRQSAGSQRSHDRPFSVFGLYFQGPPASLSRAAPGSHQLMAITMMPTEGPGAGGWVVGGLAPGLAAHPKGGR
jgi:hypothetical protein